MGKIQLYNIKIFANNLKNKTYPITLKKRLFKIIVEKVSSL